MAQSAFVLIYDPDASRGEALRDFLRDEHEYPCVLAGSVQAASDSLERRPPHVVIARLDSSTNGEASRLLDEVLRYAPDASLVAVGGDGLPSQTKLQVSSLPSEASPAQVGERLRSISEKAVARRDDNLLRESARRHTYEVFEGIVGESPKIREIIRRIQRCAEKGKLTVLILGETGTGKDLIAEAIHRRSPRARKPFVPVNCAAFSESLLESQLFGHVKGAFTGAYADQKGLFQAADGGTIFLDEIGEMPQHLQAKLLRVLERREFMPLGSSDVRRVDVRIIAATNSDLAKKVAAREFRDDLYYRLHQWEIVVPPLRERRQDVPLLALHFLSAANSAHDGTVQGISSQATQALVRYLWPGNVRELRNLIEVLVVEVEERQIELEDLPQRIRGTRELAPLASEGFIGLTLAQIERLVIEKTLLNTSGNREQAAKILDIGVRTLYRKIKEFGL